MSTKAKTKVEAAGFPERLVEACGTSEPARIGRMLEVSYQTAKNYLEGRLPAAEVLITIAASTGVSLNWLLTGQGPKHTHAEPATESQPPERRLQNKWALRRGDLELAIRAPEEVSVAVDAGILQTLSEALEQIQSRPQMPQTGEAAATPSKRSNKAKTDK